jgi:hypothetical protein
MNIQPTSANTPCLTFSSRYKTTKLPNSLKARPQYKPSKGLMIAMIPIALFGFGVGFWQIHKEEAMQKYKENMFKKLIKRLEEIIPADSTKVNGTNTITLQEAISVNPENMKKD